MTSYNDVLTVTQLTDLVAFLQVHYKEADRPGYKYRDYDSKPDRPGYRYTDHTHESDDDPEGTDPQ